MSFSLRRCFHLCHTLFEPEAIYCRASPITNVGKGNEGTIWVPAAFNTHNTLAMPTVVSAASNHFWASDAAAQIVSCPGAAPVMHPQRLYLRDSAVVLGDPTKRDMDPCRSHAALEYLKKKHSINLGTVHRPSYQVPTWVATSPAVEAFARRCGGSGVFLSPCVPPDLARAGDRRKYLAQLARRRRGLPPSQVDEEAHGDENDADRHRHRFDPVRPSDLYLNSNTVFERGEASSSEANSDFDHY